MRWKWHIRWAACVSNLISSCARVITRTCPHVKRRTARMSSSALFKAQAIRIPRFDRPRTTAVRCVSSGQREYEYSSDSRLGKSPHRGLVSHVKGWKLGSSGMVRASPAECMDIMIAPGDAATFMMCAGVFLNVKGFRYLRKLRVWSGASNRFHFMPSNVLFSSVAGQASPIIPSLTSFHLLYFY